MKALVAYIIRNRLPILVVVCLVTLFFGYHAFKVQMYTVFSDLLPRDHPYIRVHKQFNQQFGGANLIFLSVEVTSGDIFNPATLGKVKKLTEAMELLPGVSNYQIFSIAREKVKDVRATSWGIQVKSVMWPDIPKTQAELEELRHVIYSNGTIAGRLVSLDGKAALITAAFDEERLDYSLIFRRVQEAIRDVEDNNTRVYAAGEPILYGWIYHHLREISLIFAVTLAAMILTLYLYYQSLNGVVIPLISAATTAVWGTGFTALLGYNFDPLILVVPFLIAARTMSHSVQFRERFFEELAKHGERERAAQLATEGLLTPGLVSIVTDAVGVLIIAVAPIPMLEKLAYAGAFWVLSNIVSVLLLDPILCCYFPVPKHIPRTGGGWTSNLLARLGAGCCGPARYAVFGVAVALMIWGGLQMRYLTVGDARPGSPLLWPDSKYNVSVDHINEKFQGTDQLFIIVDGKQEGAIKSPQVLERVEALQLHLEESPHVGGTSTVADLLKQVNKTLRNNDPRWWLLPSTETDAAQLFGIIEYQSEPGDLARWINYNVTDANVIVFLRDHRGDTIREIIQQTKDFIASQPADGADLRLAGGLVGVLAAANEVIGWADAMNLVLALSAMFLFCAVAYRSFVAGGLFVLILGISNLVSAALLAYREIGLNVNNLPVISLGIGFGVDYGIYVVSRIIEEYRRLRDLGAAVATGVSTAGKAVLYTALIVTIGIIFWRFSPLRFQAEMGEQLAIILILNMLGGLFLLPSLIYMFRPKFVTENRRGISE